MKSTKSTLCAAGTMACLTMLGIANADPVVYSADNCVQAANTGGSGNDLSGTPGYYQGTMTNGHNDNDMSVLCPIVGLGESNTIDKVRVRVWDDNTSEAVQCTVGCRDAESSETYDSLPDSSTAQDDTLIFDSIDADYSDGGCSIYCTLPDKGTWYSYILEYKVILD